MFLAIVRRRKNNKNKKEKGEEKGREPFITHGPLACFPRFADSILLFML
jgi:hypothetical protein